MSTEGKYIYRDYRDTDRDFIISLLAQKRRDVEQYTFLKKKIWNWQYVLNPNQGNRSPILKVCERDGKVVGAIGLIPIKFMIDGEEHLTYWGLDLVVDEITRGGGVGTELLRQWRDYAPLTITFSIADIAFQLEQRLGWRPLSSVKEYIYITRPANMHWRELAKYVFCYSMATFSERADEEVVVSPVGEKIPVDYDELWKEFAYHHRFVVTRDRRYMEWRYVQHPFLNYIMFEARCANRLVGFLVLRISETSQFKLTVISEIMASKNKKVYNKLLDVAMVYSKNRKVHRIHCVTSDNVIIGCLKERGYYSYKYPPRFNVHQTYGTHYDKLYEQQDGWYITAGDSDNDYGL